MNTKSTVFAITLSVLSSLAATSAVQAQEYVAPQPAYDVPVPTRAQVQADTAAWRAAGLADATRGEQTPDIYGASYRSQAAAYAANAVTATQVAHNDASPAAVSLAQVQADTAAWRAAGLADASRGEQTPDIYSAAFRSKVAAYAASAERIAMNGNASNGS